MKIYIYLALAAVLFASGWKVNGWRWEAKQKAAIEQAIIAHNIQVKTDQKIVMKAEIDKQEARIIYRTIYREAKNVENCSIPHDSDYVRLWNSSNSQATAAGTN